MADENDQFDIGLDIESPDANLFETFHRGQAADAAEQAIDLNAKPSAADVAAAAANNAKGLASTTAAPEGEKVKEDISNVLDLAKEAALNPKLEESDTDESGEKGKVKTAAAKTAPENQQFQILYDHLVAEMGYEALPEEELVDGMNEDKFLEFQERNLSTKALANAEEMIANTFEGDHPNKEVARDLFRFLINGGKTADFVATRANDDYTATYLSEVTEDTEIEERAEKVMRAYYKSVGWEEGGIEKTIKTLKTSGTLNDIAENTLPQFIKQNVSRKAIADQTAIQQKSKTESQIKEYNTKLFEIIDTTTDFGQFKLTPKVKKDLKEYMYSPTVEVNGNKVPRYLAELEIAKRNPNFAIYQALNLMNKQIDLSGVQKAAANAERINLKEKLTGAALGKKLDQPASAGAEQKTTAKATDLLDFDNIQFAN